MDLRWSPVGSDTKRNTSTWYHPSATPLEMVTGTHVDGIDLSEFATRLSHSASEGQVTLSWHRELDGAAQPKPGHILELREGGMTLWWGIIEGLNDYRLSSGQRVLNVLARSRDASPFWRETRRISELYPVGTPLHFISSEVAESVGLTAPEMMIPESSNCTVHSNTQLADLTAWEMLEKLNAPQGLSPFVDAIGRLKFISRDILRASDAVLTDERLLSVSAAKARPPLTAIKLKWLDPNLSKVIQQAQQLAAETITAGYFQIKQRKEILFSADGRQRAENTYLVIRQSANSSLVHVCEETYSQLTQTSGEIVLLTSFWVPTLISAGMGAMLATAMIPDAVAVPPVETIPTGRVIQAVAGLEVLLVMASIGTGMYEIWGNPYDFIHARNTTEAYDDSAPSWMEKIVEIENDFVMDEAQAQAFAVRELIFQVRAASLFTATIVDDPRIEKGDIIELADGSRLWVEDYRRDCTSGTSATLEVQGFRA